MPRSLSCNCPNYCIGTVAPSGDHDFIDIVVPSSDHCCTETVSPSSDHYGTTKVAPPSDHLQYNTIQSNLFQLSYMSIIIIIKKIK